MQQTSLFGVYFLLIPLILEETRTAILLIRMARKKREETGDSRYRARVEDERPSLKTLLYISCTRPIGELVQSLTLGINSSDALHSTFIDGTNCVEFQCR
jgi:hypothetical protein